MHIAIVGSGGVGGYFGARLARGGADVTFLARGAHLAALRAQGIAVEGPEAIHVNPVRATDDPAAIGIADIVLFAVKLWDTESVLEQIRPVMGPDTAIVSFQNGVLKDTYLRAHYDPDQVMGGVGYVATTIDRPGVIRQTGPMQRLIFGEFDGRRSARGEAFLQACLRGGINAELSPDIRREIWQKFVFLVGLSSTTTTMRLERGPHIQSQSLAPKTAIFTFMAESLHSAAPHATPSWWTRASPSKSTARRSFARAACRCSTQSSMLAR